VSVRWTFETLADSRFLRNRALQRSVTHDSLRYINILTNLLTYLQIDIYLLHLVTYTPYS